MFNTINKELQSASELLNRDLGDLTRDEYLEKINTCIELLGKYCDMLESQKDRLIEALGETTRS